MKNDSWQTVNLGQAINLKRGYDLRSSDRRSGGVPVVSSSGITGTHDEAKVKAPGVVTGRYGTLGEVYYLTQDFWPLNTTLYVQDFKGNYPLFVYYLLQSLDFSRYSDKSSVPGLNRNHLHTMRVSLPPLPEQRAIAHILGTLDDKIELNRRMNATLEGMARTIFKSWFVDFEPVHAKARGEQPAGMDAETAALFPDSFEESELGLIPKGWKVEPIGKHIDATKGLSYKGSGLANEGIPLHNLNSVYEGGGYKYEGIKFYKGDYRERHLVKPGDVIVTNTEQGFDLLLIGYAAIVPKRFGNQGLFSHHLYRVRPKPYSPITSNFMCHLFVSSVFHSVVAGYSNGTTVNMLPPDALEKPLFAVPSTEIIEVFEAVVKPMRTKTELMHDEATSLVTLRNTLLPLLTSGEIRIRNGGVE